MRSQFTNSLRLNQMETTSGVRAVNREGHKIRPPKSDPGAEVCHYQPVPYQGHTQKFTGAPYDASSFLHYCQLTHTHRFLGFKK
ncbi:hypothetical protein TNCV_1842331 [Trichonephila clavipes]|nr:hypothetical protein TNCV_1842331 [Trichonephila clavipes]